MATIVGITTEPLKVRVKSYFIQLLWIVELSHYEYIIFLSMQKKFIYNVERRWNFFQRTIEKRTLVKNKNNKSYIANNQGRSIFI